MGYYYREDDLGDMGAKLMIYLLIIFVIVMAVYYLMLVSLAIGAIAGGGMAVYNYGVAFWENVKPQGVLRRTP